MNWIIPLEKAVADVGAAGGKAANLGMLIEAGLPVPHGFVLTTAAYHEFIRLSGLQPAIDAAAAEVNPGDPNHAELAAAGIAHRFIQAELPVELIEAVRAAYDALDGVPVAVRSSVVTHEETGLPFHGQGETVLNVLGEDALLEAIRTCWISLWSGQALVFRAGRRISPAETRIAVIIQHMFRAEVSGVIMTVNTQTQNPDEMVIQASHGLGDAVLRGQSIPQEIIFNRYTRTITRQSTPGHLVIMPDQALELARLGERIESHFGCHQVIEWAWDEDTFCILQSHPIPQQIPPRIRWEPPQPGTHYTRQGLIELLPEPVSTLFETCGLPALEQGIQAYHTHLNEADSVSAGSFETINGYVYQREGARGGLTYLLALPRMRRAAQHAVDHWVGEALIQYQQEVERLKANPQTLSPRELANRITSLAQAAGRYWAVVNEMMQPLEQAEQRFRTLYARLAKPGDPDVSAFLCGLETRPLQAERAFSAVSENRLEGFIEQFGCAIYQLDFARPLAGEDLSAWQAARNVGERGIPASQERFLRLYGARITAEEHMQVHLTGRSRRMFGSALNDAQRAVKAREDALFELGLAWALLRQYALELGRRLVAAEALNEPEEVFWLRRNELFVLAAALEEGKERVVSQVAKVQSRQAVSSAFWGIDIPVTIPKRDEPVLPENAKIIEGRGVGSGKVSGTARLLHSSPDFAKLELGDIIVASAIPPAWTPLFSLAAGVVLDLGGPHSCSSRAAALTGLPVVVETAHATRVIPDGATIMVDGDAGIVIIE
jgi:rifampicin phosphotransferase